MDSLQLLFFSEHVKEADAQRNAEIDRAMDRANMGTLARTALAPATGGLSQIVPMASYAAGAGVEDQELRDAIRERTMTAGSLGQIAGGIPGGIYMGRSLARRDPRGFALGLGGMALGGLGGEMIGQRYGLSRLKRSE